MSKSKQLWTLVAIIIVILSFAFYWYSWRPTHVLKYCSKEAYNNGQDFRECLFNAGYPVTLINSVGANNNYNN